MHKFNLSCVFHFYIFELTSWIWTNPSTETLNFESPFKMKLIWGLQSWTLKGMLRLRTWLWMDVGWMWRRICHPEGRHSAWNGPGKGSVRALHSLIYILTPPASLLSSPLLLFNRNLYEWIFNIWHWNMESSSVKWLIRGAHRIASE